MRSRTTTIAEIMPGVACCGVLFHVFRLLLILVRMPGREWLGALLISTPGPVIGGIVQRYRGGFVVLGAVIGGMVWNVGVGLSSVYRRTSVSGVHLPSSRRIWASFSSSFQAPVPWWDRSSESSSGA